MARSQTDEIIAEIRHPIRRNDLQARRRRLKLSRVALARILDVDPATVFRQERGVMSALWDYAMRGVEAEAKLAKPALQSHQASVDSRNLVADGMVTGPPLHRGEDETAEAARQARPDAGNTGNRPRRIATLAHALAPGRNGCSGQGGGALKIE
jgi:hypothetical protein